MEHIGGIAGGALGYIINNERGAITGYEVGRRLTRNSRNMATHRRRRSSIQLTPSSSTPLRRMSIGSFTTPTGSRRRLSFASSHTSTVNNLRAAPPGITTGGTGGASGWRNIKSNVSALKVRRKKGISKKKKKLKISRKLRRKVKNIMTGMLHGRYTRVTFRRAAPPNSNEQQVMPFGTILRPLDVAEAAAVLFNGATPQDTPVSTNWNANTLRIDHVINSYCEINVKNMSQRTYYVKFFNCKSRGGNPTDVAPNDALADWTQGLIAENLSGVNPLANTPQTLYSDPRDSGTFRQMWNPEVHQLIMSPGQSHTFFVQGPNEEDINYDKLLQKNPSSGANWLQFYTKSSRSCFLVWYEDLVTSSLATVGRYASGTVGQGGMVAELKHVFRLKVPESAGFQYPAVYTGSANQQLTYVKPTRAIFISGSALAGTPEDVLEDNPISVINPAD